MVAADFIGIPGTKVPDLCDIRNKIGDSGITLSEESSGISFSRFRPLRSLLFNAQIVLLFSSSTQQNTYPSRVAHWRGKIQVSDLHKVRRYTETLKFQFLGLTQWYRVDYFRSPKIEVSIVIVSVIADFWREFVCSISFFSIMICTTQQIEVTKYALVCFCNICNVKFKGFFPTLMTSLLFTTTSQFCSET